MSGGIAIVNTQVCSGGGNGNTVTDIDGNVYSTVTIGTQVWMQENLKVSKYRDGSAIPNKISNTDWYNATSGAFTIYNNDTINNTLFGKLYNWYAVADPRGLCPSGWHVPTNSEWYTLENYLDPTVNDSNATGYVGTDLGGKLKAVSSLWTNPNTGATNSSGFTALPGGNRNYGGSFLDIRNSGYWWSSTQVSSSYSWFRYLNSGGANSVRGNSFGGTDGFSVRCLKD